MIVCVHIEIILIYSIILLVFYLMPEEFRRGFSLLEFLEFGPENWMGHAMNILTVFCAGLVAPFFVSAGFVLYINRRTHLEGWDIELQFRRMLGRLQSRYEGSAKTSNALVGMFCGLFLLAAADTTQAQESAVKLDPSKKPRERESSLVIEEVLDHEDFGGEKTERYLRYVGKERKREPKQRESSGLNVANWVEGFLWILSITVGVVFLIHILRNAGPLKEMFRNFGFRRQKEEPVVMFNLDISPDSLPKNLAAAAMQLARDGQHRAALSLLYRGSLSRLVHERGMVISASATEQQCLDKVLQEQTEPLAPYFATLTNHWLRSAYARKQVDDERTVQVPKSSLAYKHKLLAAGRYLERYGYNVETADSVDFLKELPSTNSVIIFNYFPGSLTDDYYTRIEQWVRDGGHLITGFFGSGVLGKRQCRRITPFA